MYIGIIDFLRHEIAFYDIEKLRLSKNICVCAGGIWKRWGGGYNLEKYNIGLIEDRTIKEKAMVTYEEALKLTIEGDAVFLVGSGFSIGAENVSKNKDRHLLVGSELAKELADLTGMDSGVPLDIVS